MAKLCATVIFLFLISFIDFIICDSHKDGDNKLIFAHVIYRHGDRTPINTYPNDPWGKREFWPVGWGQLTNLGKQRHYELGQWLRKRYENLVNVTYSKDEVYIRSTDVDRTLMSALSNLAGFYPPQGNQVWNSNIAWQPIPVHTVPEKMDTVLAAKKPCDMYEYLMKKLKRSEEFKALDKELKGLYEYLTVNSGKEVNSMENVQYIYNALFIESAFNFTLPEWTKEVYPDKMAWVSARSFATSTYTRPLALFKSGSLLKEMLDRFHNKTISKLKPNRSLWIYSAHDTTVANMLNTLGVFEYHNPPYTACIMLELRLINKKPYVSVFYKNTTEEPQAMYLPKCGTSCALDKMYQLYEDVLPKDLEAECRLSMLSMTYDEADLQPALLLILCVALGTLLILVILSCVTLYRRRNYPDARWYLQIDS